MTHPSVEEVADHLEGLLGPDRERDVAAHLGSCDACAGTAGDLAALPGRLREAAGPAPAMPDDVAARLRAVIADEAGSAGDDAARAGAPAAVGSFDDARRRRRRGMATGLLAAAAVTVAAVGIGEALQTGGSGQTTSQADGGASVASPRAESDSTATPSPGGDRTDAGAARPRGDGPGVAAVPEVAPREQRAETTRDRLTGRAVVAGVAARYDPAQARVARPQCVSAVVDTPLADVAAVEVTVPEAGGPAGVVVLRPRGAPTEGLLLACSPRPHLVLRQPLGRGLDE